MIHPPKAGPTPGSLSIDIANENDLLEVSRIAAQNFSTSRTYESLKKEVIARFAERNSVENLRKKLHSARHVFIVAKEPIADRIVGFAIYKKLSDTSMLATRMHVIRDARPLLAGGHMHRFILNRMRQGGYDLLYGDLSGETGAGIARGGGFLFVDSFKNKLIKNARIDRVVIDTHAREGTAIRESAFIPLLSDSSDYAHFVTGYGLVLERLFQKVERMHKAGSSGISQSVFAHLLHGLELIKELRDRLEDHLLAPINWTEVETMWLFHDIGEIGMDSDIPSYKKTRHHSRDEAKKATRILDSISSRKLRTTLLALHARYEKRKTNAGSIDREATICAFVDKLEAANFIGSSGIGAIWKRRAGRWLFKRILKKNALGAFITPARELCSFLDPEGQEYIHRRLTGIMDIYRERELISGNFLTERTKRIAAAVAGK